VTSRARQPQQAAMLVSGHGVITAEFFDTGESRTLQWARRPQATALVAQLADPGRGWDAVVIGEYEPAFYGSQYASMARCSSTTAFRCGCRKSGAGRTGAPKTTRDHVLALGLSSERGIIRTRIRVRTAMAAQTLEQGRYLGGRPPHGYRLADAGPHPNKAHAAWGRRARKLEPDPVTAPVSRTGKEYQAEIELSDILNIQTRMLGPDRPDTEATRSALEEIRRSRTLPDKPS
jgi:site-specific DNA recombinase